MGKDSKIEWTDHTFNPWWGCVKVSPGCRYCYAETQANRYGDWWGGAPRRLFEDKHWNRPYSWNKRANYDRKRARVFCGSMCDVFEDNGLDAEREKLWKMIEVTYALDWLLLTKRPENVKKMLSTNFTNWYSNKFPPSVWMGVSIEDHKHLDDRMRDLLHIPARVRFLSLEPLLGEIDLSFWLWYEELNRGIDWVIIGGESGPQARKMDIDWVNKIIAQCEEANVPVFVKQLGTWWSKYKGWKDYKGGNPEEWGSLSYLDIREFPE